MKQEFGYFLKNAKFRAALGLTLLLSYGYAIATTRVSIDSLEGDRYIGTGGVMLSTGRFGMNLWAAVLGYSRAEPCYDNFAWFLNGVTDALLAAQNLCVEAEAHGLGICYLGTTIYTAEEIARILDLPKGVIPVTTIVVGHPDESPELTDRLPLEAVVHYEKYTDYTAAEIDELWAEREESELTKRLLAENGLPNLAQVFTQRRYVRKDNLAISESYFALLKEKGFFNN